MRTELAEKDLLRKPNNTVKIISIISAVILTLAIMSSIILGLYLPRTERIFSEDSGRITSIAEAGTDDWYYTTSAGYVYHLDDKDNILDTYHLSEQAKSLGVADCGEVRSIYGRPDMEHLYIFTSNGYFFQLEGKEDKMAIRDWTKLPSSMLNGFVHKNGELYLICKVNKICQIMRYDVENLSQGPTNTGYIYQGYSGAKGIIMQFLPNITIHSFDVVEENGGKFIYILHTGGLIRMSANFEMNAWEGMLANNLQARADALFEESYQAALNAGKTEESINKNQLKEQAWETACEEFGIVDYNEDTGEVILPRAAFKDSLYGYYRTDGVTYTGAAFMEDQHKYYLLSNDDRVYEFDLDKTKNMGMSMPTIKCDVVEGVTLAAHPKAEGTSMFYNKYLKVGYVAYQASNKLTRIDFSTMTVDFTSAVEFDVRALIQSSTGDQVRFLYLNANEAASGTMILRSLTIGGQNNEKTFKALKTVSTIIAIIAAIVTLIALSCWFIPGQLEKTKEVGRGMKKNWKIFVVFAFTMTLLGMFCYYPAIGSIQLSFYDYTLETPAKLWNNFAHYKTIFTSVNAAEEFGNMIFFLISDLLTALAPPLIFAFFLTIMRNKSYSALTRTLLFIPGVIPGVASTLIWKTGIYGEYGVLNAVIQMMNGEPIKFLAQTNITKWSLVLMGFPYVGSYLIFYGAMMNVPDSYYEAAELDGITVTKRFIGIDIPLIFPQIKYVIIMTFIASVQNFARVYMITGGDWGTKTPIFTMYTQVLDGNYGLASAYATVIFVFLFAATVLNFRMQKKDNEVA